MPAKIEKTEISILEISQGEVSFAVLGTSPLIFNRMAEKAKRELLMPYGRKTAHDKAVSLKHSPVDEFRDSVYRNQGADVATRLRLPAPCFKGAMANAALDLPGTRKTEIGRLCWVPSPSVDLYGIPELLMSVVRSADINKTPDIRSRAIVPHWACKVTVRFVQPKLTASAIANLMAAAGIIAGVGDFRQEKGKGSYGQFQLVDEDDERYQKIIATGAREAQDEALNHFRCHDDETAELLEWFDAELKRRGRQKVVNLKEVPDAA